MNEVVQELCKLTAEHPDLPVIPIVPDDICIDDSYCCWRAGEYTIHTNTERQITEPLNDLEQRIFLAAISREEKVCKSMP